MLHIDEKNVDRVRKALKEFYDDRRNAFLWVWSQVSDNPKKAGVLCLVFALTGFFLGRMTK